MQYRPFVSGETLFEMNLINFMDQYPDEDACKLKFKTMRDDAGVTYYILIFFIAESAKMMW